MGTQKFFFVPRSWPDEEKSFSKYAIFGQLLCSLACHRPDYLDDCNSVNGTDLIQRTKKRKRKKNQKKPNRSESRGVLVNCIPIKTTVTVVAWVVLVDWQSINIGLRLSRWKPLKLSNVGLAHFFSLVILRASYGSSCSEHDSCGEVW